MEPKEIKDLFFVYCHSCGRLFYSDDMGNILTCPNCKSEDVIFHNTLNVKDKLRKL